MNFVWKPIVADKMGVNSSIADDYKMPTKLGKGDHTIKDIIEFFRKRRLMGRYAKKINPNYYANVSHMLAETDYPIAPVVSGNFITRNEKPIMYKK